MVRLEAFRQKHPRGGRREGSRHERGDGTGVVARKTTGMAEVPWPYLTGDVHQPDWHLVLKLQISFVVAQGNVSSPSAPLKRRVPGILPASLF